MTRVRVRTDGTINWADSFTNLVAGLGMANPKTSANTYALRIPSQFELETAYRASSFFRKIVNIPADDAVRGWRRWLADKNQIEDLEAEEKRLKLKVKLREALIWQRLYGGAVIIPGGLPGDPAEELRLDNVRRGSISFLTVLHRYDPIQPFGRIRDPMSPFYGQPEYWSIQQTGGRDLRIHPSRVIFLNGIKASSNLAADDIWGDSVWTHLQDSITGADSTAAVIKAMMIEAKVDIVKIAGMMKNISTNEYEQLMIKRFMLVAMLKSVANVTLLDKDDEWTQKQISWQGIPDVIQQQLILLSGAADIPLTRLIGTSAKGLNATGEGDLRNYYDNVKARQELDLSPSIDQLDELIIRSSLGSRDQKIWYDWNSLWQPTQKEQAEVDKLEAETVQIYANSGLVPSQALAEAIQNRMIESGRWPGLEEAIAEFGNEVEEPEEPTDPLNPEGGEQIAATDAAPRTLYVRRDVLNAREIIRWAKQQGFKVTVPENELHVTIAYSREPIDWMKVGQSWSDKIELGPGGPRLMEQFGEARVLLISSRELTWRHNEIREAGASYDFPEYQPHITISYDPGSPDVTSIEPYKGRIVLGPEIFEEVDDSWREELEEV